MATEHRAESFVRYAIAVATAALAVVTVSACDSHNATPAPGANPRQVTVVGSGQVQGVPDTLTADVGIEFSAPDVTTAMNQTNDRQQAVINALVGAGLDRKDISTTQVTLQPQYGSPESTITGYRATNAIQVKIHPTDAASRMLALVVSTGGDATRISSVSYSIADDSQLVKDARARAFNDAKNRADQYAQLSGLRLGKVLSISESTGGSPVAGSPPAPPKAMATAVPLEPGQQTVSFSVTAAWELD
ncbi:SIMPL domain-containing protein [Mycobacterium sp. 050272]|uniref:SIMPL domain-containing protein n=1 Tax=Mycobacterium sp. 050272 TaxID=3142488 RepID=UPI00318DF83E